MFRKRKQKKMLLQFFNPTICFLTKTNPFKTETVSEIKLWSSVRFGFNCSALSTFAIIEENRSQTRVPMSVPAEFLVDRWRRYKTPRYKTGTNWLCQIMGPLTKPAHVCLCLSVSFILDADPKKVLPNHTTPLMWIEGHNKREQKKKKILLDGDFLPKMWF